MSRDIIRSRKCILVTARRTNFEFTKEFEAFTNPIVRPTNNSDYSAQGTKLTKIALCHVDH